MMIKFNLIPQEKKEEQETKRILNFVFGQALFVLFSIVFFAVVLWSMGYILDLNFQLALSSSETKADKKTVEEIKKYDEEFEQVNARISALEKIKSEQFYWSKMFLTLDKVVPENVAITSVSTKKTQILVSGNAKNREDLVVFKNNLEKEKCFEKVNLPLSNLMPKSDVDFKLDFEIKENCIKIQ